jgi:protein involved in ribonucleotide reduction
MNPNEKHASEDQKNLARMGYEQELFRGFSAFSNYALSMSIICILAGGITSFHMGYCAAGPAASQRPGRHVIYTFERISQRERDGSRNGD